MIPISCQCRHTLKAPSPNFKSSQSWTRWAMNEFTQSAAMKEKPSTEIKMILVTSFKHFYFCGNLEHWLMLESASSWQWRNCILLLDTASGEPTQLLLNWWMFMLKFKKKKKNYNVSNNEASVCTVTGKLRLQAALHPGSVWWEREKEKISLIRSSQAHKPYPHLLLRPLS